MLSTEDNTIVGCNNQGIWDVDYKLKLQNAFSFLKD